MKSAWIAFAAALAVLSSAAPANIRTLTAFLSGLNEVGPNASPAAGVGSVVLDDSALTITVNESWAGLTAPATASHIHGPAPAGVNAGVLFPFSAVPAATAGAIPQQVFSITPTQVTQFDSGLMYMNVHTSTFPGGEIRGQLLPEPGSLALAAVAGSALIARRRRRHRRM